MRSLKTIYQEINRCQLQIVAIFELPETEQLLQENKTILEGFQMALKNLYHERQEFINHIKTFGAGIVLPNGSKVCAIQHGRSFEERALQTCKFSIQQLKKGNL